MLYRVPRSCAVDTSVPRDHTDVQQAADQRAVSYTHLRAHETVLDLVCRLLLEKKKNTNTLRHESQVPKHSATHTIQHVI